MQAPIAKKIPTSKTVHQVELKDDYAWLKEKENPEVKAYLEAENAYTQTQMAHTEAFQKELYKEMLGRIQEDDTSVPYRKGNYWYYTRTEAGKPYTIHCRKLGSLEAPEEVILDENALAEGHEFFDLGDLEISQNEKLVAYTVDTDGSEKYSLYLKDLSSGETTLQAVRDIYPEVEWANDNKTLFYIILDEATHRPYQLYRFEVGGAAGELVFEEPDDGFYVTLSKTKDDKYFLLYIGSNITTEMYFFSADRPTEDLILFQKRQHGVEFGVEHHEGYFYVHTNEQALDFRIMRTKVEQSYLQAWETVIPYKPQVKIDDMDVFKDFLVVYLRREGLKTIRVQSLRTGKAYEIPFEEPVYTVSNGTNLEFDSHVLRFNYSSLTVPATVYDFDLHSRERVLKKRQPVLGGFDPELYQSERIFATAEDGTRIPISLVYRKDLRKDGPQPTSLYSNGCEGV